jgi:hypothetical protein
VSQRNPPPPPHLEVFTVLHDTAEGTQKLTLQTGRGKQQVLDDRPHHPTTTLTTVRAKSALKTAFEKALLQA